MRGHWGYTAMIPGAMWNANKNSDIEKKMDTDIHKHWYLYSIDIENRLRLWWQWRLTENLYNAVSLHRALDMAKRRSPEQWNEADQATSWWGSCLKDFSQKAGIDCVIYWHIDIIIPLYTHTCGSMYRHRPTYNLHTYICICVCVLNMLELCIYFWLCLSCFPTVARLLVNGIQCIATGLSCRGHPMWQCCSNPGSELLLSANWAYINQIASKGSCLDLWIVGFTTFGGIANIMNFNEHLSIS